MVAAFVACRPDPAPPASPPEILPPEEVGPAYFSEITESTGVSLTYRNGEEANHLAILESLGGGVALLDYDGDGLLDIFLTGGGRFQGKQILGLPCKLYRNLGNGKFEDVTERVGLSTLAGGVPWFYSHGAAVADYDRDGWPDLLVTGWERVALFRNVPVDPADPKKGRRFLDVTASANLDRGFNWATSAAFGDLDGDGYPDLYVCQYVDWSFENNPPCHYETPVRDVCPPRPFSGLQHKLFRNDGRGKFVDVTEEAGLLKPTRESSKGLGVLMVDLNGDGKPEVYVANDGVPKFLYLNESQPGKIRLREVAYKSGTATDDQGKTNASMGVDAADYDGSGRPSLWVTNYEQQPHDLYHNENRGPDLFFRHQTVRSGIAEMGQKYVGWGTAFIDVDLDGWEDIFVANGHATRFPQGRGATREQPPVLYRNQGGTFKNVSRQIGGYAERGHMGRGVGFGDLDNDGRVDLVISNVNEPAAVLRGIGGEGRHWVGVALAGKDHADAVGARVELETGGRRMTRFAKGGGSYLSSGDRRIVFGLGDAPTVEKITVTWPNGRKQEISNPSLDRYLTINQE
jgi:hypothetical protein